MMLKLLIVDDEKQIREGLSETLDWKSIGISEVLIAKNGNEAFDIYKKYMPELIITDIRMPGMDGLELCQSIKEYNSNSRIMLLSGHSDFQYAKQGILIGVNNYFTKPVNIDELLSFSKEMVKEILDEKKYNEQKPIDKNQERMSDRSNAYDANAIEKNSIDNWVFDNKKVISSVEYLCYEKINDRLKDLYIRLLNYEQKNKSVELAIKIIDNLKLGFQYYCDDDRFLDEARTIYIERIKKSDLMYEVIQYLKAFIITGLSYSKVKVKCNNNKNVVLVCEYIKENFHKELSTDILADYVNRNAAYLSHLFKKKTGLSINEYICAIRIEESKKMLRDSSLMAYEIADEIGIDSYKYFYGIFKKFTGLTPTEYRNKYIFKEVFI